MSRTLKPKRTFTPLATPEVKQQLERLLNNPPVPEYRDAMTQLGRHLGAIARERLSHRKAFALVTTPEDADFLVRGMISELPRAQTHLACYWTTRHQFAGGDVATVKQSFVDPSMPTKLDLVVIAKSIIASGCIVRTNLEKFLTAVRPQRILIAAPVMLHGAEARLRDDFPDSVSKRFEFVTFATDAVRDGAQVTPGVGGQVEERLGLRASRIRSPALVKEWRSSQKASAHA